MTDGVKRRDGGPGQPGYYAEPAPRVVEAPRVRVKNGPAKVMSKPAGPTKRQRRTPNGPAE